MVQTGYVIPVPFAASAAASSSQQSPILEKIKSALFIVLINSYSTIALRFLVSIFLVVVHK
jgi:hypothetical protein